MDRHCKFATFHSCNTQMDTLISMIPIPIGIQHNAWRHGQSLPQATYGFIQGSRPTQARTVIAPKVFTSDRYTYYHSVMLLNPSVQGLSIFEVKEGRYIGTTCQKTQKQS